jgi:hypothetical protein
MNALAFWPYGMKQFALWQGATSKKSCVRGELFFTLFYEFNYFRTFYFSFDFVAFVFLPAAEIFSDSAPQSSCSKSLHLVPVAEIFSDRALCLMFEYITCRKCMSQKVSSE